jgi:diguanylate cyclase (GGDEF)-like protein
MSSSRSAVTLSGDRAATPSPPPSRFRRSGRRRRPLGPGLGLVAGLVGAALLPLALATLAFGQAFRSSETARVDGRLAAALQLAADRASAAEADAIARARLLASSRRIQVAMLRHDDAALAAAGHRTATLAVIAGREAPPPVTRRTVLHHEISVVSGGSSVGFVRAEVFLVPLVAGVERDSGTATSLVVGGSAVSGTLAGLTLPAAAGTATWVKLHGATYRAARGELVSGRGVVAAVSRNSIDTAVRHRQLRIAAAGVLTVVAVALVALLLVLRRRGGVGSARSGRSPMAVLGEVVAAADDPRARRPGLLETAVAAVDAAGGFAVWDGERMAEAGFEPAAARPLSLELDPETAPGQRQIVLFPRRGSFSAEEREVAASLVAEGRIALDNARLHNIVRRQAVTDELTDLANRRRFVDGLRQEVARARRFELPLALVLFDLDHFKQINDRYGHQAGDEVLREAADVIRGRVRETDLPGRVGGEEFAVILMGTDLDGAAALAENLRADLPALVNVGGSGDWRVTASFGVAELGPSDGTEELIAAADRALYRAKAEGRDRVSAGPLAPR